MTVTLNTETPAVKIGQLDGQFLAEGVDGSVPECYRQEPFQVWLAKRIRNVYPK